MCNKEIPRSGISNYTPHSITLYKITPSSHRHFFLLIHQIFHCCILSCHCPVYIIHELDLKSREIPLHKYMHKGDSRPFHSEKPARMTNGLILYHIKHARTWICNIDRFSTYIWPFCILECNESACRYAITFFIFPTMRAILFISSLFV